MAVRTPAAVVDPREFCWDEIAERGLTKQQIPVTIKRWLDGTTEMDLMVAQALSALLATSQSFWINLNDAYHAGASDD